MEKYEAELDTESEKSKYSTESEEIVRFRGNEWDKGMPLPGEYHGEYIHPFGEGEEMRMFEEIESSKEFERQLIVGRDPKLIMMEEVKNVLYNLITDRPENVIDYFEEYVRNVTRRKEEKTRKMGNTYTYYFKVSRLIDETFKWIKCKDEPPVLMEGEEPKVKHDYIYFNQMNNFYDSGMTMTHLEIYGIGVALQEVQEENSLGKIKFWGKILGLYNNYYILEADVTKSILDQEREKEQEKKKEAAEEAEVFKFGEEEEERIPHINWNKVRSLAQYIKPPMPKSTYEKPKFAPNELLGRGVNGKIYFASNKPTNGYTRLPEVTPEQIVRARQIKRYFSGFLNDEILSDPPFPGNESNYLRAQIARISAGTHLSPLGFYSFDLGEAGMDEEEEDEGEEFKMKLPKPTIAPNPDFEPLPLQDLVDPTMAFWAHHREHILPQGRAVWVDPTIDLTKPKPEGEDFTKKEKPEPEVGPPLLTAASEDMNLEMIPPWSTRLALDLAPNYGGAVVRSNLWLGAITFALHNEVNFDNVYIGWGHKYNACSFTPITYFIPQKEYEIGPDTTEIPDPTPEEEDYEEILYWLQKKQEKIKSLETLDE